MNIPQSAIRPFEPLGIPTLGVWNESASKWLTKKELWRYLFERLEEYIAYLRTINYLSSDDIEKAIIEIMKHHGADVCYCKRCKWRTNKYSFTTIVGIGDSIYDRRFLDFDLPHPDLK